MRSDLSTGGTLATIREERHRLPPAPPGSAAGSRRLPAIAWALAVSLLTVPAAAMPPTLNAARTVCLDGEDVDPDATIAACTRLIEAGRGSNQDLSATFLSRGLARAGKGEDEQAIRDFDEAIRRDPTNATAHRRRGHAHMARGEPERALADFEVSIRLRPSDPDAFADRASYYEDVGDLDRAAADYGRSIALNPADANTYLSRASILQRQGNFAGAVADLDQSIRLDPRSTIALSQRGTLHLYSGNLDRAIGDFDASIRVWPGNPNALADRCVARWRQGQREAAFADCADGQRVLRPLISVPNGSPWVAEAGLRLLGGDLRGAQAATTEALRRNPDNAQALALRSLIHQRQGDSRSARADMAAAEAKQAAVRHNLRQIFGPDLLPAEGR